MVSTFPAADAFFFNGRFGPRNKSILHDVVLADSAAAKKMSLPSSLRTVVQQEYFENSPREEVESRKLSLPRSHFLRLPPVA